MVSVDAYLSFCFLRPHLSPWEYRNRYFLVAQCHLIVWRPNLEVATKRLLHQEVKISGSFSAMLRMEVYSYSYFWYCGHFWAPWVSFVMTDEYSVRFTKITARIGVSGTHSLPFCFWPKLLTNEMAILSKGRKPDNFESESSLKLSFTNIQGLF